MTARKSGRASRRREPGSGSGRVQGDGCREGRAWDEAEEVAGEEPGEDQPVGRGGQVRLVPGAGEKRVSTPPAP